MKIFKFISLLLTFTLLLSSCGNKDQETNEIELSKENIQNYLKVEIEYTDFKIDTIDELIGENYRYNYVCTIRYKVSPRGDYKFRESKVLVEIRDEDLNEWRSSCNVSKDGNISNFFVYRREKIYLDLRGYGECETVWRLSSTNVNVGHPKYEDWNWQISGSGTIVEE